MIGRRPLLHVGAPWVAASVTPPGGMPPAWPFCDAVALAREAAAAASLARLRAEREPQIFEAAGQVPAELSQAGLPDLGRGQWRAQTVRA